MPLFHFSSREDFYIFNSIISRKVRFFNKFSATVLLISHMM
nr:MAG TPA: hypothetical protein [Caudoviricetes sp.]